MGEDVLWRIWHEEFISLSICCSGSCNVLQPTVKLAFKIIVVYQSNLIEIHLNLIEFQSIRLVAGKEKGLWTPYVSTVGLFFSEYQSQDFLRQDVCDKPVILDEVAG